MVPGENELASRFIRAQGDVRLIDQNPNTFYFLSYMTKTNCESAHLRSSNQQMAAADLILIIAAPK